MSSSADAAASSTTRSSARKTQAREDLRLLQQEQRRAGGRAEGACSRARRGQGKKSIVSAVRPAQDQSRCDTTGDEGDAVEVCGVAGQQDLSGRRRSATWQRHRRRRSDGYVLDCIFAEDEVSEDDGEDEESSQVDPPRDNSFVADSLQSLFSAAEQCAQGNPPNRKTGRSASRHPGSLLLAACARGDKAQVEDLISNEERSEWSADLDAALVCAAGKGLVAIVRQLLKAGADPNARAVSRNGASALMAAVHGDHVDCCRLLCVYGADVLLRHPRNAVSALSLAQDQLGPRSGLTAYLKDTATRSPLQRCVESRDLELVRAILRSNVHISSHGAAAAVRLGTLVNPFYGLPVEETLVQDLRAALQEPWTPSSSHLFPEQFQIRATLVLSSRLLPRDLWEHVISFLPRRGL